MSPAAMNFSSSDTTPHPPLHFAPFNADATISSVAGSTARGKSRPRLTKLRKQSATQNARSRTRTADAVDDEVSGS
ncbi:chaperone protein dnaJ, partial [Trifolium medium]|nr:chaperone protein dnaJ [Trifolium medium]